MSEELKLIKHYLMRDEICNKNYDNFTLLGQGDDCALIRPTVGTQLAISTDMLVSGTHFFANCNPYNLGHKALAVNLSDLAAMGAKPRVFTLAIALPNINHSWLSQFSEGMYKLANHHYCRLIGGDTIRGPLAFSITVIGELPTNISLRRDCAKPEDDIWVSGTLGSAALGLKLMNNATFDQLSDQEINSAFNALEKPIPRIDLGIALRDIANSAIDISDGLMSDLGHLMSTSHLNSYVYLDKVPCASYFKKLSFNIMLECILSGGDDYELCFTAPSHKRVKILHIAKKLDLQLTRIGKMLPIYTDFQENKNTAPIQPTLIDNNNNIISFKDCRFDHFYEKKD